MEPAYGGQGRPALGHLELGKSTERRPAGEEREGDDLGSARARGEAERVAWARPGSHHEERDLDEWEDRANELGNDPRFRRQR